MEPAPSLNLGDRHPLYGFRLKTFLLVKLVKGLDRVILNQLLVGLLADFP